MAKKQLIILIVGLVCILTLFCRSVSKNSEPVAKETSVTQKVLPAEDAVADKAEATSADAASEKETDKADEATLAEAASEKETDKADEATLAEAASEKEADKVEATPADAASASEKEADKAEATQADVASEKEADDPATVAASEKKADATPVENIQHAEEERMNTTVVDQTNDKQKNHSTFNIPKSITVPRQDHDISIITTAASCFKVEGIASLQIERGEQDYLILNTDMRFENFTDQVLGTDKKREIWLKDLDVTVFLTDTRVPPKKVQKIVDGKIVVMTEYPRVTIGKVAFDDFIIPKNGLSTVLPIAMDQVTKDGNKKEINNPAFDRNVFLFNLMNSTLQYRETCRIVCEGTCKIAIKGENNTWMWAPAPVNFVWLLKPYKTNDYLLKIVEW